ncbi:MAG: hypothetical protein AABW79_03415 [Nanoarchaeota archaeon]
MFTLEGPGLGDFGEEEMVEIVENLVDYLHRHDISNVALVDKAARPAYIGIKRVWDTKYPEAKRPEIYFFNPLAFKSDNSSFFKFLSSRKIIGELKRNYKKLIDDKTLPIMVFDTCMHTGRNMSSIVDTLERTGFEEIHTGVVSFVPVVDYHSVNPDFQALDYKPSWGCYPFGEEIGWRGLVENCFERFTSSVNRSLLYRGYGLERRRKIIELFEGKGYSLGSQNGKDL